MDSTKTSTDMYDERMAAMFDAHDDAKHDARKLFGTKVVGEQRRIEARDVAFGALRREMLGR